MMTQALTSPLPGMNFGGNGFTFRNPFSIGINRGQYVPMGPAAQMQAANAGESQVRTDAEGEAAQRDALRRMRGIADTGYSDIDRAAMASSSRNARANNKTMQASTMRDFQRRGMGGSNAELSAALIGGQGSADRLAEDTRQINARGQERRTEATRDMSNIGGVLNQNQFTVGGAQNQMNQYNAGLQQQAGLANMGALNQNNLSQYQGMNQYFQNQMNAQNALNLYNQGFMQQMGMGLLQGGGRMMGMM